jgi:2-oxoglutarate ferredoxin oxidoreductase subunit alpha
VTYRTPVIVLSDGSVANGSEPWRSRTPRLPRSTRLRHGGPNSPDVASSGPTCATTTRSPPWAVPARPGLEHRIGGLEKADGRGSISYDPTTTTA